MNIVSLDEARRAKEARRTKAPARGDKPFIPDAPRWFCSACDADQFKLYAAGAIHCANCGALTRNLTVVEEKP